MSVSHAKLEDAVFGCVIGDIGAKKGGMQSLLYRLVWFGNWGYVQLWNGHSEHGVSTF